MGPRRSRARPAVARRSPGLPPVCYLDSSTLFKLAVSEAESRAAWLFVKGFRWVSSELMVTEIPRAIRGRAAVDPNVDLALSLGRSEILLDMAKLYPIEA